MDARVVKPFRDAEHMEDEYQVGAVFSGSEKRVKSLAERGFVEPIRQSKPAPRKRAAKPKES